MPQKFGAIWYIIDGCETLIIQLLLVLEHILRAEVAKY